MKQQIKLKGFPYGENTARIKGFLTILIFGTCLFQNRSYKSRYLVILIPLSQKVSVQP